MADRALMVEERTLRQYPVGSTFRESLQAKVPSDIIQLEYADRVHEVTAYVCQEHLADDHYVGSTEYESPATTWQMFKQTHKDSWWLGWLVIRRPVRMQHEHKDVTIKVGRYLNYPEANVKIQQLGRPFPFETIEEV